MMSRELTTVLERKEIRANPPPLFDVLLLNDDYTPMEFVVDVLGRVFGLGQEAAVRVMLQVHTEGRGLCGTYPHDIAATRVARVVTLARAAQHPLQCIMEERGS
ncbi:ATP-dependent Clp protease adapter ClpS [Ferrovum sp.]|uniref:ATP-dependent Clp protease adapter ClpS n=1 Tax=Ferrovum sp. TaxID=2609467 RepID=UPI00261B31D9|nr:ATP-dependent Clp protease adapter ClpS [Ferrovum sp.]